HDFLSCLVKLDRRSSRLVLGPASCDIDGDDTMRHPLQWMAGLVLAGFLAWPRLPLAAQGGRTAPVSIVKAPNDLVLVSADTPQVRAGPRSVTVVIVPVPRELPRDTAVSYEAIPAGDIQFLGQRTGQVSGAGVER